MENDWSYALHPSVPAWVFAITTVCLVAVGSFSLVANLAVVVAFVANKKLHTPFNVLLMNLICVELSTAFVGIPFEIVASVSGGWIHSRLLCICTGFGLTLLGMASIFTLTALSLHRWLLVTSPGKFSIAHFGITAITLIAIWTFALALAAPPLFGWAQYQPEPAGITCAPSWDDRDNLSYSWYLLVAGFFVPLAVIVYSSFATLYYLRTESRRPLASVRLASQRREARVTRMVIVMVVAFTVSWTPYALICILRILDVDVAPLLSIPCLLCAKSASCWNPIIYVIMNKQFRVAVIPNRMLCNGSDSNNTDKNLTSVRCLANVSNRKLSNTKVFGDSSRSCGDLSFVCRNNEANRSQAKFLSPEFIPMTNMGRGLKDDDNSRGRDSSYGSDENSGKVDNSKRSHNKSNSCSDNEEKNTCDCTKNIAKEDKNGEKNTKNPVLESSGGIKIASSDGSKSVAKKYGRSSSLQTNRLGRFEMRRTTELTVL